MGMGDENGDIGGDGKGGGDGDGGVAYQGSESLLSKFENSCMRRTVM